MLFALVIACALADDAVTVFNGTHFVDGWRIINTAGTQIKVVQDEHENSFLWFELRPWDTVRVERSAVLNTKGFNFLSYTIEYNDAAVQKMRFRTRLFSEPYNQQTETELKPYDYLFKAGKEVEIFVPLTNAQVDDRLQVFSLQRIETTDGVVEFRV